MGICGFVDDLELGFQSEGCELMESENFLIKEMTTNVQIYFMCLSGYGLGPVACSGERTIGESRSTTL